MKLRPRAAASAAVLCAVFHLAATHAAAQDVPRTNAIVKAVHKVKPCTVGIRVPGAAGGKNISGSGVIIDERGYVVTNRHVVVGADKVVIRLCDQSEYYAKVVVADPNTDLAILKADAGKKLPYLPLAPSSDVEVGEDVIAMGHPYGYEFTVSRGIVSALKRSIEMPNGVVLAGMIQTDASINPGNSGGPLVNINGEFIGVVTALRDGAQGIAFAIQTDTVKRVLGEKLSALKVAGVSHGLQVQDKVVAETGDRQQVLVSKVSAGAAGAGLKSGDVIRCVGNLNVKNSFDVERALFDTKPGQQVSVRVLRQGQEVTLTLTLTSPYGDTVASNKAGN
jgi:serine protease Do